ncbi:unnamed protein product [Arabidopsis thaliana]|uniref:Uncharacterized protein n=1 Tax=Arabidopsis thaliana TaxID=3702 RepID=A0A654FR50_ARATH|nr:unnamed protein product [Arabidopsis thaliana]
MVHPRFVFFAFLALSVLLADIEATKVMNEDSILSSNKGDSLCCNDHPEFGICQPQLMEKIVEGYLQRLKDIHAADHFRKHTVPELRKLTYRRETNTKDLQKWLNLLNDVDNILSNWRMIVEPY